MAIGSDLTVTSGWRIWVSSHFAVRRMLTPRRSGQVTRLPKPWQTTQPLPVNSRSPALALDSSIGDAPARGPSSRPAGSATAVPGDDAEGVAGAEAEAAGSWVGSWLPPH